MRRFSGFTSRNEKKEKPVVIVTRQQQQQQQQEKESVSTNDSEDVSSLGTGLGLSSVTGGSVATRSKIERHVAFVPTTPTTVVSDLDFPLRSTYHDIVDPPTTKDHSTSQNEVNHNVRRANSTGNPHQTEPINFGFRSGFSALTLQPSSTSLAPTSHRNGSPLSTASLRDDASSSTMQQQQMGKKELDSIQLYPTWTERVENGDLVRNLSERERARQEVLMEVVASEERYVVELQSLLHYYVLPLLHPRLQSSPTLSPPTSPIIPSPSFTPLDSSARHQETYRSDISSSRSELPIAARFLKSVQQRDEWEDRLGLGGMPEIQGSVQSLHHSTISSNQDRASIIRRSLPPPSHRNGDDDNSRAGSSYSPSSQIYEPTIAHDRSTRLLSLPSPSITHARHPLRPALSTSSSSRWHKTTPLPSPCPISILTPLVLPEGLKRALESIPEMMRGHEELSRGLRLKWEKDFPLVRSLGGVWSEQPWFLPIYSNYILALETALLTIDSLLPSTHSPHVRFYSTAVKKLSKPKSKSSESEEKRLIEYLMRLEERAFEMGESGIAICLSKPLMRLGKLPLLMQSLLYYTDASTVEYERTRSMAIECDNLVRSIEDEKIEEDEREKVRDCFARIDGIQDLALMAPRSRRILLDEVSIYETTSSSSPPVSSPTSPLPRSPSTASHRNVTAIPIVPSRPSIKRLSALLHQRPSPPSPPSLGSKNDLWLIHFTDVIVRVQRTGTTSIPTGFALMKKRRRRMKRSEQEGGEGGGKKERNLYRFVEVERWVGLHERYQRRRNASTLVGDEEGESSEEEESEEEEEEKGEGREGAESRMSFTYTNDEPTPNLPSLIRPGSRSLTSRASLASASSFYRPSSRATMISSTTQGVVEKDDLARDKFGGRLRVSGGAMGSSREYGGIMGRSSSKSTLRASASTSTTTTTNSSSQDHRSYSPVPFASRRPSSITAPPRSTSTTSMYGTNTTTRSPNTAPTTTTTNRFQSPTAASRARTRSSTSLLSISALSPQQQHQTNGRHSPRLLQSPSSTRSSCYSSTIESSPMFLTDLERFGTPRSSVGERRSGEERREVLQLKVKGRERARMSFELV